MKRAVLCALLLSFSLAALAQLSGKWEADLTILPAPPALEKTVLTLSYTVAGGWILSSTSTFTDLGLTGQAFGLSGRFGPAAVTGGIEFNPQDTSTVTVTYPTGCSPQTEAITLVAPAYTSAWLSSALVFAGAEFALEFRHWAFPYTEDYIWPCCPPQTGSYTTVTLTGTAAPLSFAVRFEDCCTGLVFRDVTLSLIDVPLCCGIAYDTTFYFTKMGFGYIEFVTDIPLCCGIALEASVKFTVDAKQLKLKPKWVGIGEACVEIYGDVLWDPLTNTWDGLVIHGYKLRCELAQCHYVELLTALDVDAVETALGEDVFQGDEFEYVKLGFCGPGCCGGTYTVDVSVYFQPAGTLFGFSRLGVGMGVPLLANFTLTGTFAVSATGAPELGVGWTFSF